MKLCLSTLLSLSAVLVTTMAMPNIDSYVATLQKLLSEEVYLELTDRRMKHACIVIIVMHNIICVCINLL